MKLTVVETTSPWYKDGLRFECTQCGNCCTGGPGYVWLTDDEIHRLAAHLKMSLDATIKKYCRNVSGRLSLKEKIRDGLHDCIFLEEVEGSDGTGKEKRVEKKRMCAVYAVRPTQCRTWPFWEGNLLSSESWEHAQERCPGMGKGKLYPQKEIDKRKDA